MSGGDGAVEYIARLEQFIIESLFDGNATTGLPRVRDNHQPSLISSLSLSSPWGNFAFSISKATMLMMRIQIGESRSSGSFFTKLMAVTHWDSSLQVEPSLLRGSI